MSVFLQRDPRRILAYRHPVDMRKSYDGLMGLVQTALHEDPLSGDLFVFFNRKGTHLKLVFWDRTGYCLFAKRLERGRFALPGDAEKQQITVRVLELILDGIPLGTRRTLGVQNQYDSRREGRSPHP